MNQKPRFLTLSFTKSHHINHTHIFNWLFDYGLMENISAVSDVCFPALVPATIGCSWPSLTLNCSSNARWVIQFNHFLFVSTPEFIFCLTPLEIQFSVFFSIYLVFFLVEELVSNYLSYNLNFTWYVCWFFVYWSEYFFRNFRFYSLEVFQGFLILVWNTNLHCK